MDKVLEIGNKKEGKRIDSPVRLSQRLLTLAQGAAYLGRGQDSLRELLYRHELRCIQKGKGKVWLDVHELDRWIDSNLHFM